MIGTIQITLSEYGAFISSPGYGAAEHIDANNSTEISEAVKSFIEKVDENEARKNDIVQYSVDVKGHVGEEKIVKVLEDAEIVVYGSNYSTSWKEDEYFSR